MALSGTMAENIGMIAYELKNAVGYAQQALVQAIEAKDGQACVNIEALMDEILPIIGGACSVEALFKAREKHPFPVAPVQHPDPFTVTPIRSVYDQGFADGVEYVNTTCTGCHGTWETDPAMCGPCKNKEHWTRFEAIGETVTPVYTSEDSVRPGGD